MSKFIEKLSSGKFFATVCVIITYCISIIGCLIMTIQKIISVEVFLGIFVGFAGLAQSVITGYFNKEKTKGIENET